MFLSRRERPFITFPENRQHLFSPAGIFMNLLAIPAYYSDGFPAATRLAPGASTSIYHPCLTMTSLTLNFPSPQPVGLLPDPRPAENLRHPWEREKDVPACFNPQWRHVAPPSRRDHWKPMLPARHPGARAVFQQPFCGLPRNSDMLPPPGLARGFRLHSPHPLPQGGRHGISLRRRELLPLPAHRARA